MKNFLFIFILLFITEGVYAQKQDPILKKDNENSQWNRCSHLSLKTNGDTISCAFCSKYLSKEYSFQTTYIYNQPSLLIIYKNGSDDESQVAEFWYYKNEWKRRDYHGKSVSYRNRLLKIYLKRKDSVRYNQIWYEE